MIDAITYKIIVNNVYDVDANKPVRMYFTDSIDPVSRDIMAEINKRIKSRKLIGIMFCNPNSQFCKNEILSHLNYFHQRSGNNINFFCCGYGADWPKDKFSDQIVVSSIDGVEWSYSDQALITVIHEFESRTQWEYSGENELLLLDVTPGDSGDIEIHNAIVCNLEKMKSDSAFTSVRAFFEGVIRHASKNGGPSSWGYSDSQGINIAKSWLKEVVIGILPPNLASAYRKAENYAIKKI